MRLDGVLDLECARWTRIVVASAYSPTRGARTFRNVADLVDYLLGCRGWWWSWAGGHYDMLAILEELRARGIRCQINRAGSRLTSIVVGDLRLLDAYALCPLPLDEACSIAGIPPVGGIGWPCRCGAECGGYCMISEVMPLDMIAELAAYCENDCRAGYRILKTIFELAADTGLKLRSTVGGTAWATAQERERLPAASWHWSSWRRAKRAYHGGRVCIGHSHAPVGQRFDIRGAYPAALSSTPVPVGDCVEVGAERAGRAYRNGVPGIYRATVTVPPMHLPPLPWVSPSGRIAYPFGRLRGAWTAIELEAAEERGCSIDAVHSGLVWPDGTCVLFAGVVDQWNKARTAARLVGNTGLDGWYREIANSLTGKLGESPNRLAIVMNPDKSKIVICDGKSVRSRKAGCSKSGCTKRCDAWQMIDRWGLIWGVPVYRQGASSHVQWAAYLTAANRIKWQAGAEQVGEAFIYGNTDSVYTLSGAPDDVGEEQGQFVDKGSMGDWECLAPNRYKYIDGNTGEVVCRVAGMARISDRQWVAMRERDQAVVDFRGVLSFGEAAGAGGSLFRRRARVGRLSSDSLWRGDRMIAMSGGRTYPVSREAIEERDRSRTGSSAPREQEAEE